MPLILPGNVASATAAGYDVANSCRFNSFDTPQMHKTPGSAGNLDNWTLSVWIKRSNISSAGNNSYKTIFGIYAASGANQEGLHIQDDDVMYYQFWQGGSKVGEIKTNRKFRDVGAWYHIVIAYDSTNGTAGDRIKMYVNGVRETSFSTTTDPTSGLNSQMGGTDKLQIGCINTTNHFDGYMAEVVYVNGSTLDATSFGEFDEDSPTIWKPKDVSGLTFGTNGFYLDFEDSSNLGNDASGGTDFTEVNLAATDQATDTPTNNFATMNPLDNIGATTFSEGNNLLLWTATNKTNKSTIGVTSGKWYAECKAIDVNSGTTGAVIGVGGPGCLASTYLNGSSDPSGWGYRCQTGNIQNSAGNEAYGDTWAENDIIGVALDMDNGAVYMSKNGTWQDSGDPTSGASKTNAANNQPSYGSAISGTEFFACSAYDTDSLAWNFGGCPSYAISSGNADADGYGNFEYAPPSGYYALCTKNLAEYG